MGFIADNYGIEQTSPLMTDKYHLATAYAYWLEGRADNPSVFYMFGRKEATGSGYTVAAGLEGIIDIVTRWQEHGFTRQDLAYLRSLDFPTAFIDYLAGMTFKLKIDAAPEGSVFFPQEPVLRVQGPIAQVKMLESVALCLFNGHSAYASHAARQISVIEQEMENGSPIGKASIQGLRRGPGLGAAIEASRSLGLGGYKSTSTGTSAKLFGQVFAGTMDHAWVMTHSQELGNLSLKDIFALKGKELQQALKADAFRSFAFAYPDGGIFLVDTYDPLKGLENAITVLKELRALGRGKNYGVRFDSGEIVGYSRHALQRFAQEGFIDGLSAEQAANLSDDELLLHAEQATVFCAAADGIDEYTAQDMRRKGGFFKAWGIGTAGSHVPPLGLVYKASSVYMDLLEQDQDIVMTPVMKVAAHAPVKSSNPGLINARRYYNIDGLLSHITIYDEALGLSTDGHAVNLRDFSDKASFSGKYIARDLLVQVFDVEGNNIYRQPAQKETFSGSGIMTTDLEELAAFVQSELAALPENIRRVERPETDLLKSALLSLWRDAKKSGQQKMTIDLADIDAAIAQQPARIPVYLDINLYNQRMACEEKQLAKANHAGVDIYEERFEQTKRAIP